MSNTSENTHSSCSASGQTKCAPVGLLLFVGFILGFSVGFGTHDIIYTSLSKAMYGGGSVMSEPINRENDTDRTKEEVAPGEENTEPGAATEVPTVEEAKSEEKAE